MPSYYYLGWRTYEDFSYGSQNFQSQGSSSYNYQEPIQQPSDEELFYALLNEIKKDNATWEAKIIDKVTNEEALVTNLENPTGQLAHALEEQYSRPLPSAKKDEDIRECNFVPLVEEKKNDLANEEEQLVEERKVEEQNLWITIENVLVGIVMFNFPIDFVTLGMEEDQQVSSIGRPSISIS